MAHPDNDAREDGRATLEVTAITHRGRVRAHNEDTIVVGNWICGDSMDEPRQFEHDASLTTLLLVADGMGGHVAGREASRRAARAMVRLLPGDTGAGEPEIADALRAANREVFDAAAEDPALKGMGTTVAGLVVTSDRTIWFNVGDSRVYSVRQEFLRQLSVDDVPAWQGAGGHVITQALGGAHAYVEVNPHVGALTTAPGRRYLLCSDGLTDVVPMEAMERALADDDLSFVGELLDGALAAGGPDNVSIVAARIRRDGQE